MFLNKPRQLPKHIAITMEGNTVYANKKKLTIEEVYKERFSILKDIIEEKINLNIPMLTVYVSTVEMKNLETFPILVDTITEFFEELKKDELIHKNKIKISVLGKWYNLPGRALEPIKAIIDESYAYDKFFVNFLINYDGQQEIVDASKLIAMKVRIGKLDPEAINKETIKENLYGSYMPPDLIIKTGRRKILQGLLLWDSIKSKVYFSNKLWPEFTNKDFNAAIEFYKKN